MLDYQQVCSSHILFLHMFQDWKAFWSHFEGTVVHQER